MLKDKNIYFPIDYYGMVCYLNNIRCARAHLEEQQRRMFNIEEQKEVQQSSLRSRLSYSLTDGCGNLLYCIIGSYLLYFYTDVFGLSVAVTGTLLLVTRLLDAIDAPVWGFIVDHTK